MYIYTMILSLEEQAFV